MHQWSWSVLWIFLRIMGGGSGPRSSTWMTGVVREMTARVLELQRIIQWSWRAKFYNSGEGAQIPPKPPLPGPRRPPCSGIKKQVVWPRGQRARCGILSLVRHENSPSGTSHSHCCQR